MSAFEPLEEQASLADWAARFQECAAAVLEQSRTQAAALGRGEPVELAPLAELARTPTLDRLAADLIRAELDVRSGAGLGDAPLTRADLFAAFLEHGRRWLLARVHTLVEARAWTDLLLPAPESGVDPLTDDSQLQEETGVDKRVAYFTKLNNALRTVVIVADMYAGGQAVLSYFEQVLETVRKAKIGCFDYIRTRKLCELSVPLPRYEGILELLTAQQNPQVITELFQQRILDSRTPMLTEGAVGRFLAGTQAGQRLLADQEPEEARAGQLARRRVRKDDGSLALSQVGLQVNTPGAVQRRRALMNELRREDPRSLISELTALQQLIMLLVAKAYNHGYLRSSEWLYTDIWTVDPSTRKRTRTRAFRPVCNIRQFVIDSCEMTHNHDMWRLLNSRGVGLESACRALQEQAFELLPEYIPYRYAYSFRNGIVCFDTMKFYRYTDPDLPDDLISTMFMDVECPYDFLRPPKWVAERLNHRRRVYLQALIAKNARGDLVDDNARSETRRNLDLEIRMLREEVQWQPGTEGLLDDILAPPEQPPEQPPAEAAEDPGQPGNEEDAAAEDEFLRRTGARRSAYRPGRHVALTREVRARIENRLRAVHRAHLAETAGQPRRLANIASWRDLPTPVLKTILDHQEYTEDEHDWFFWAMGRMLFSPRLYDNNQVACFFMGRAGTGKSTLQILLMSMLRASTVGLLSSTIEKTFGLHPLLGKKAIFCMELGRHFGLEQVDFQSIVTASEPVKVSRKGLPAVQHDFDAHVSFSGNEIPEHWNNSQDQIGRRVVWFDFPRAVGNEKYDGRLTEDAANNGHTILFKIVLAYLEKAAIWGDDNIWNALPARIIANRRKLKAETNVVEHFLQNGTNKVETDRTRTDDWFMSYSHFMQLYQEHVRDCGLPRVKLTKDHLVDTLAAYGLVFTDESRTVGGKVMRGPFILGIRAAARADQEEML